MAANTAAPSITPTSTRYPCVGRAAPDCKPAPEPVVAAAPADGDAAPTEPVMGAFTTTREVAVVSWPLGRVYVLRTSELSRE